MATLVLLVKWYSFINSNQSSDLVLQHSLSESVFGDIDGRRVSSIISNLQIAPPNSPNLIAQPKARRLPADNAKILHLVDRIVATRTQAKLSRNIHRLVSIVGKLLVSASWGIVVYSAGYGEEGRRAFGRRD